MSDINSATQLEMGEANLASPFLPTTLSVPTASAPTPGLSATPSGHPSMPTFTESVSTANPINQLHVGEANLASSSAPTALSVPTASAPTPGFGAPTNWGHPGVPTFGDLDLLTFGQSLAQAANLLFASPSLGVGVTPVSTAPVSTAPVSAAPVSAAPVSAAPVSASATNVPSPGVGHTAVPTQSATHGYPGTPTTPQPSGYNAFDSSNPFASALRFDQLESSHPIAVDGLSLNIVDPGSTGLSPSSEPRQSNPHPVATPGLAGKATETSPTHAEPSVVGASNEYIGPTDTPSWIGPGSQEVPKLDARSNGGLFDPHSIRRQFPILQQRVNGKPLVWLDNAATTQKPQVVIDRLKAFYENENSNIHRAAHTLAARATDAYESARKSVQRFINAPSVDTVVFARGATEAINLVAQTFGSKYIGEGDEIVISWLEHHANIVPWQQFALQRKARLRVAPVDDNGDIILSEYQRLLNARTRLVAFTQVSNALGTITPAHEMIELAHRHGARVLLDGAQSISHMPVDVQALDCDFYVFSGHKVFAPTGIGALYGKSDLLETLPPWQGGGNMIQDVTFERVLFQKPPARFEAGTGNIADAVGLGAALDWLSGVGIHNVERYEHELLEYGLSQLANVPGLRMIGNPSSRAGVLSFVLAGQETEQVGGLLDKEGIAVRSGHHCAQPILRRFGVEASVRASLAPYNTHEDIDALVSALQRLQVHQQRGARRV